MKMINQIFFNLLFSINKLSMIYTFLIRNKKWGNKSGFQIVVSGLG